MEVDQFEQVVTNVKQNQTIISNDTREVTEYSDTTRYVVWSTKKGDMVQSTYYFTYSPLKGVTYMAESECK